MQKIFIYGRLTKDVELRVSAQGMAVAKFSVACNRDRDTTDFHNAVAFGKTAELIDKSFRKGSRILFEGELQNNNWTDKNNVKHYDEQIVVNRVEFIDSKNEAPKEAPDNDGFMDIPAGIQEELPFK